MIVYLNKSDRDRLMGELNDEQREFLQDSLKRGKRTYYANFIARLKANKGNDLSEQAILDEMTQWELVDYIDGGMVTDELKCECGKSLRYQYIVQNNKTGKVLRFGITHFEQHTGFPPHIAKDVVKGLQEVDLEMDEVLSKWENGWKPSFDLVYTELLPREIQRQLSLGLPLTNRQEEKAKDIIREFIKKQAEEERGLERKNLEQELSSLHVPEVDSPLNPIIQKAVFYYFNLYGASNLEGLCEWLLQMELIGGERYVTGKLKAQIEVAKYIEALVQRGYFSRTGEKLKWVYVLN
ncbi:hypothetical protein AM500_05230 [Bacillus sp. FJAT-18017]|uniref:hypothetical protein n=1 Tax=Bacillus sp. FJAT-18017 TaxID=1705566 RepID=UPI0006AEB5DB|nr:hypothetical protein [Bacillus sp. FJAT-18017]ALC89252.1 hypothetical protein AM500_05230 [Bacillus sp. FJAT-18017]